MKRSEIRDMLKSGVDKIRPQLHFGSGRLSEWSSALNKQYTSVWWESIVDDSGDLSPTQLPIDDYPISLHIGKQDTADSSAQEYEAVIDSCHEIAQQLFYQINQIIEDSSDVSIASYSRSPFVKKYADRISGVVLSFNLKAPDKTKVC